MQHSIYNNYNNKYNNNSFDQTDLLRHTHIPTGFFNVHVHSLH